MGLRIALALFKFPKTLGISVSMEISSHWTSHSFIFLFTIYYLIPTIKAGTKIKWEKILNSFRDLLLPKLNLIFEIEIP